MGCCNEKRARWGKAFAGPRSTSPMLPEMAGPTGREFPLTRTIGFEYVGETALSVLGPMTRTQYRFRSPGARIEIDHRDAPFLSGVPNLRRVQTTSRSEAGLAHSGKKRVGAKFRPVIARPFTAEEKHR